MAVTPIPTAPAESGADSAREGLARQSRWRRCRRRHAAAALALATAVAGMLHYLAARHYGRWDFSRAGFYRLSTKTENLLAALTDDVEITVLLKGGHPDRDDVQNLLREYQLRSPHIRIARIDPDRDPARMEQLLRRVPVTDPNVVIFAVGDRTRVVAEKEWIELEAKDPSAPKPEWRRRAFRGEAAFSSAIHSLVRSERPIVYFLEGNGEKSIESAEPGAGLSHLDRLIRQDNIETRTLRLDETRRVPSDAAALVMAGPRRRLPQPALDMIQDYLERQGRAILLLSSRTSTGLEELLRRWGVRVGDDIVIDPEQTLSGLEVVVGPYPEHPITAALGRVAAVFYRPRSVEPLAGGTEADRPRLMPLATTSARGWAETDFDEPTPRFDPGRDRPGPVTIALAIERGAAGLNVQLKPTRIVVFGDAEFVADGALRSANGDFFLGALHWLIERPELMGIAPKPIEEMRLVLTSRQRRQVAVWALLIWPGIFAAIGFAVRAVRRR